MLGGIIIKTTILLFILIFAGVFMLSCTDDKTVFSEDDLTVTGYFLDPQDSLNATSRAVIIADLSVISGSYTFIAMNVEENLFEDVRTGDKIRVPLYAIFESFLPQIAVSRYELIERGTVENIIKTVPEDIFEIWQNNGWLRP